ncbi:hypothetical protein GCM10023168_05430 [Fodinibacter luteus]|uniref:WD40 repeat domain-containing protein n=1 Tax=Fodinibacter luteus TaxID=552064 RepID=A0ABP8K0S8_9MICO
MSTERLVREALENSVKGLPCPEPKFEQLLAAGRAARRRRVATVASLAAAAVLVLVLAGLTFAWVGRAGTALEPVPANPTTSATIGAPPSELQQWIDALPAGAPPATPYWHDGTLYVNSEQIPAPYAAVNLRAAGDTVLVAGYDSEAKDAGPSQWGLVRGGRLELLPVPSGIFEADLSVDGRIAYWVTHVPGTTRFFTWDTETNTALASRTVNGRQVELWGIDAAGNGYWAPEADPVPYNTRWDIRANTDTATDLTFGPWDPPESFEEFIPWMHNEDPYRSPDGTKVVVTGSVPSDSPSDCCLDQLRVRPVGPDASLEPQDVTTLSLSQVLPSYNSIHLDDSNGYWVWWESNDSVLVSVDGDSRTYLVRCPADGGDCQRVVDLAPRTDTPHQADGSYYPHWDGWAFARAPVSQ